MVAKINTHNEVNASVVPKVNTCGYRLPYLLTYVCTYVCMVCINLAMTCYVMRTCDKLCILV